MAKKIQKAPNSLPNQGAVVKKHLAKQGGKAPAAKKAMTPPVTVGGK